jgi:hypothetical protein
MKRLVNNVHKGKEENEKNRDEEVYGKLKGQLQVRHSSTCSSRVTLEIGSR